MHQHSCATLITEWHIELTEGGENDTKNETLSNLLERLEGKGEQINLPPTNLISHGNFTKQPNIK